MSDHHSKEENTTRTLPSITENMKIKTNIKTAVAVISATVVGTAFFFAVMHKLDNLNDKLDAYEQATKMKINYLFHQTGTYNPFEGSYNDQPSPASPPVRNPANP